MRKRVYGGGGKSNGRPKKKAKKSFAVSRPIGANRPGRDLQTVDSLAGFGGVVTSTMLYSQVFLPTQGTGVSSRIGDRTTIKSIQGSLIASPGTAQTATTIVRVVLFWDTQPNGANPTNPMPFTSASVVSFPNTDLTYRFKILRDFVFPVAKLATSPEGMVTESKNAYMQKFYIGKCDLVSQFIASAGAITDLATGALVVGVISDTSLITNNTPNISFNIRTKYQS